VYKDLDVCPNYSRRLSPSEEKYSTYQRELLAIRDCLLAFRFYLVGLPFVCKTDHCSLQWLTEQAEMSPLQSRWYTVFLEYNIKEIQYIKGEKNALADALSRHPDPSSQPLDHLVPPFNMDVVGFHGLAASVATAVQRGIHPLPAPQDLFGAGAVVQPVAPPDVATAARHVQTVVRIDHHGRLARGRDDDRSFDHHLGHPPFLSYKLSGRLLFVP
jgi:hypothetical protein